MKLHKMFLLAVLGAFLSISAFTYAQEAPVADSTADAPAAAPAKGPRPDFRRGGQRGPGMFMAYRGIATEEQTKEMMEIMKSYGPQFKALLEKKMAIEKEMQAVDEEMMKLHKEAAEKCNAVLTEEQRAEVKARMEKMRDRGPRGPQGDRGPRGPRGPQGERGPRG